MKFRHTTCLKCIEINGEPNPNLDVEYDNKGRLSGTCDNGHLVNFIIQSPKHVVLFEFGLMALIDGYYREAVSSFHVALERYYEHVIKLILFDRNVGHDEITKFWKLISKQSERQYGAFLSLMYQYISNEPVFIKSSEEMRTHYFLHIKNSEPVVLGQNNIEFRNNCIHKGLFPSHEKTKKFAGAVLEVINRNDFLLKFVEEETHRKAIFLHMGEAQLDGAVNQTVSIPLSLDKGFSEIDDLIDFCSEQKDKWWI